MADKLPHTTTITERPIRANFDEVDARLPGSVPITSEDIAADAVGTSEIDDGAVTDVKLAGPEAVHVVGAGGEPAFGTNWVNVGGANEVAGFYKDGFDRVYVRGLVTRTAGAVNTIWTLPVGYRPAATEFFATVGGAVFATVAVTAIGGVVLNSGTPTALALSVVSFRAV